MPNTNFGDSQRPVETLSDVVKSIDRIIKGRINVSLEFSPTASTTSTVIEHPNIGNNSYIALYPLTREAASIIGTFSEDRTLRQQRQCTIKHPSIPTVTKMLFMAIVIG